MAFVAAPSVETRRLLRFGADMVALAQSLGFTAVAYGSLAYLAHTGDPDVVLADIDLLVAKAAFPQITAKLAAEPTLCCEPRTYNSLKVFWEDLKVSFDSLEDYLADAPYGRQPFEVDGVAFEVVDREALIEAYRRGAETIPVKREAYLAKLAGLTRL